MVYDKGEKPMSPNLKDKLKLGILLAICIFVISIVCYFLFGVSHSLAGMRTPNIKIMDANSSEDAKEPNIAYKIQDNGKYYILYSYHDQNNKLLKCKWNIAKEQFDKLESRSYYYLEVKFYKNDVPQDGNVIKVYDYDAYSN